MYLVITLLLDTNFTNSSVDCLVNRLFGAESTDRANQRHMVQRCIGMMASIRRDIDRFLGESTDRANRWSMASQPEWPCCWWIHRMDRVMIIR